MATQPAVNEERTSGFQRRAALATGDVVGGSYKVLRRIGCGGTSEVFAVEHQRLGRTFALKVLRADLTDDGLAAERFRREAKAVANLSSEFIVQVIDCGEHEERAPYLVMELLNGRDLRSLLKEQRVLPAVRAIGLALDACRGLARVHAAGLVHRDLKPENLFITCRESGEEWCKILDFGVVKMNGSLATGQGAVLGTVRYMAPEQLSDGDTVDATTDVYGLGAVLYECLCGQPLHGGSNVPELMFQVMNQAPMHLSALCPDLPPALCDVVMRSVAKRRLDRPQSVDELAALLSTVHDPTDNPTLAEHRKVPTPAPGPPLHPWNRAMLAVALLVVLAIGWTSWRLTTTTNTEAARANPAAPRSARLPTAQSDAGSMRSPARAVPPVAATPSPPAVSSDSPARVTTTKRPNVRTVASAPPPIASFPLSSVQSPLAEQFDHVDPYAK